MDKPKLEDFGITQEDLDEVESRTLPKTPKTPRVVSFVVVLVLVLGFSEVEAWSLGTVLGALVVAWLGGVAVLGELAERLYVWRNEKVLRNLPSSQKLNRFRQAELKHLLWLRNERLKIQRKKEKYWSSLSGTAFEDELARLYSALGYEVSLTPTTNDKGVDLELKKDGKRSIVQCKRHNKPVGPAVVRELYGALMASGADEAILASTGGFTVGVVQFAHSKPIKLLSLSDILTMQKAAEGD